MRKVLCCLALVLLAAPMLAQTPAPAAGAPQAAPASQAAAPVESPAMAALNRQLGQVRGFITSAAEQVPEADYAFKPTPEVRSFGALIGHVAESNYAICAAVLGEKPPDGDIEAKKTAKADLVAAVKGSFDYCDKAYAFADAESFKVVSLFGRERPRFNGLLLNLVHDWEHYGNIVTYMRLKGLVPPSSQAK